MIKICKSCGKNYEAKTSRSQYCSINCKAKFIRNSNSKIKICLECGKEFISKSNSKFCSTSCSSKHNHRVIFKTKKCDLCDTVFEYKGTTNKKYCDECRKKVNVICTNRYKLKNNLIKEENLGKGSGSLTLKGKENVCYKTGIGIYRKIKYSVSKASCELCGSTKNILVHHLDENRKNNELSNLICLCRKCHTNIHNFPRDIFGKFTK